MIWNFLQGNKLFKMSQSHHWVFNFLKAWNSVRAWKEACTNFCRKGRSILTKEYSVTNGGILFCRLWTIDYIHHCQRVNLFSGNTVGLLACDWNVLWIFNSVKMCEPRKIIYCYFYLWDGCTRNDNAKDWLET